MFYLPSMNSMLEILVVMVPVLLSVAFVTMAESKTMASMQSSLGPNMVGMYGLLQAFADAAKLLFKEYVSPTQANMILFFLGPIITLIFSLLGFAVIPYAPGSAVADLSLGMLYLLAVSSLATYGMLLAGWSANSKYAFLGSLSSTVQLISYELVLSSAMFLVVLLTNSLNLSITMEAQKAVWFLAPLFPLFCMFLMGAMAETNSAPFDLVEAESELVSGFMTEHSAVIFVFFFLAEYASLMLISIFTCMLFLAGYNAEFIQMNYLFEFMSSDFMDLVLSLLTVNGYLWNGLLVSFGMDTLSINFASSSVPYNTMSLEHLFSGPFIENLLFAFITGFKVSLLVFGSMWVSATEPSMRFDQLMSFCWTMMLPLVFAFMLLTPCMVYIMNMASSNSLYN